MSDLELRARVQRRLGTTLRGKYVLEEVIGVGGMAAVYRARHRNGSRVAIKMLHLQFSFDEEMRTRFVREGYIANGVDHTGVVRAIDDDIAEDGSVFVVMELLEGETVHALWERSGCVLPPADVVRLTLDLLDVLVAAHTRTIVHRDLKPENIFVTREGVLKVLDFGIARWQEAHGSLTQSGMTMGTPAFMSPEQALGKRDQIDGRSDLWSVGATMFTLLSGRYVHEGESFQEMAVLAATQPAPALRSVRQDVPVPLAAVVDRALAMSRHDRWPSAGMMKRALEDAWALCRLGPVTRPSAAPPSLDHDETRELRRPDDEPPGAVADSDEETRELVKAPVVEAASVRAPGVHSTTAGFSSRRLLEPSRRTPVRRRLAIAASLLALGATAVIWLATRSTPDDPPGATATSAQSQAQPLAAPSPPIAIATATATATATTTTTTTTTTTGSGGLPLATAGDAPSTFAPAAGATAPKHPDKSPRPKPASSSKPPAKGVGAPSPSATSGDIFAP